MATIPVQAAFLAAGNGCSSGLAWTVCFCSAAGNLVPNVAFYASPGDSVSIQCITCNHMR